MFTTHLAARPSAAVPSPIRTDQQRLLHIAIVGAGKMAQHHARAIRRLGELAHVVAVADPSAVATEAMRQICPEAAVFPTLEELLAQQKVDIVHVCTPPQTHDALATLSLETGCHVYVEKPFVESVLAAERLIELARSKNLKICAGHQLLYESPARRALELLPAVGALSHVESYFSFRPVRRTPDGRTPLRPDLQLLDILPHPVYVLLRFLEEAVPQERTELTAVEVGPAGTVHALVRRGGLTGTLVVTLDGRPIESYLRLVGNNGLVHADFVRSTVQRLIGPGTSGIDKLLNPFRLARQIATGTTVALGGRFLKRQRSYPGLVELFEAFYQSVRTNALPPLSPENIIETVRICEQIASALKTPRGESSLMTVRRPGHPHVAVTGGTGFLGKEVVRALTARGAAVRVLSRREPPPWEGTPGVEHVVADLAQPLPESVMYGINTVIHCAAETAGGWAEHHKNSVAATEHLLRAAAVAGVKQVIHVSSLAVLAGSNGKGLIRDDTPLQRDSRSSGPYVWGKLESERLAVELGKELGLGVKVIRPGAIVDERNFDPPGRLGRRIGNIFVAVGSPRDTVGIVDVKFAAEALAWLAYHFDESPDTLNLLAPALPTKRELIERLRRSNPDLSVAWFPRFALIPVSWLATGLQKVLRPSKPAINVAKVFAPQRYDTSRIASLGPEILRSIRGSRTS